MKLTYCCVYDRNLTLHRIYILFIYSFVRSWGSDLTISRAVRHDIFLQIYNIVSVQGQIVDRRRYNSNDELGVVVSVNYVLDQ